MFENDLNIFILSIKLVTLTLAEYELFNRCGHRTQPLPYTPLQNVFHDPLSFVAPGFVVNRERAQRFC